MQDVIQQFMDNIIKLHGAPTVIVTDRDRIFTSSLWQSLFKAMKVSLNFSRIPSCKRMGRLRGLTSAWKIILDACASQLQKDGSTGFLWLNGGTIPHTTPP